MIKKIIPPRYGIEHRTYVGFIFGDIYLPIIHSLKIRVKDKLFNNIPLPLPAGRQG
jgi:hypothetical protein